MRLIATIAIAAGAALLATQLPVTAAKPAKDIDRLIDALCGGVLADCEAQLVPNLLEQLVVIENDLAALNQAAWSLRVFDGSGNEIGFLIDPTDEGPESMLVYLESIGGLRHLMTRRLD